MKRIWLILITALVLAVTTAQAMPYNGTWLRVDTEASTTEIWLGDERHLVLEHVAFGRGGISDLHLKGDNTTPRGSFRINRINTESKFHIFLAIDYPTLDHLDRARRLGIMDRAEYQASLDHGLEHGVFPQDGTLGGYIGFHGIGEGDPDIHDNFHWTQGCIAMTNDQIEKLHQYVNVGTRVVID